MGEFDSKRNYSSKQNGKLRSALHADSMNARFSSHLKIFYFTLMRGNAYYLYTGIKGQWIKETQPILLHLSDKWTGFGMHYDDLEIIAKDSKRRLIAEEFKKIF